MNPKRRDMRLAVERIIEDCTNEDGEYKKSEALEQVADYLRENPDPEQPYIAARKLVEEYEQARKPKMHGAQTTLFDPESVLQLGDGMRVMMGKAKRKHTLAYGRMLQKGLAAYVADMSRDIDYFLGRTEAFQSDDETLEQLEGRAFGWRDDQDETE